MHANNSASGLEQAEDFSIMDHPSLRCDFPVRHAASLLCTRHRPTNFHHLCTCYDHTGKSANFNDSMFRKLSLSVDLSFSNEAWRQVCVVTDVKIPTCGCTDNRLSTCPQTRWSYTKVTLGTHLTVFGNFKTCLSHVPTKHLYRILFQVLNSGCVQCTGFFTSEISKQYWKLTKKCRNKTSKVLLN